MKAVVYKKYGPPKVLQLAEVEKPTPKDNQVLVRVHATTVTSGDVRVRGFDVPTGQWLLARLALGVTTPKHPILGVELAGEIEAVGRHVTRFEVGDRVFGQFPLMVSGSYAEYACMSEDWVLSTMPANTTYEQAVSVPFMGLGALYFVRKANIQAGQKVLINGASGAVGTYAVQFAKYYGAEVTGVCSTSNLEMVKSLGADRVIDYTKEAFTQSGETYDVILDAVDKTTFSQCKDSLKEGGLYVSVAGGVTQLLQERWGSLFGGKRVLGGTASNTTEDLVFAKELIEAGKLKAAIDRVYPLEQIVEAHRYVEQGHKKGNVIISVEHESQT